MLIAGASGRLRLYRIELLAAGPGMTLTMTGSSRKHNGHVSKVAKLKVRVYREVARSMWVMK